MPNKVFVYWENSPTIFLEAQRLAEMRETTPDARYRMHVSFDALYKLASANRPVEIAMIVGAVPPQLRQLWNRLENQGLNVRLFDRTDTPNQTLQFNMLLNVVRYSDTPGIAVLLTGDGAGYFAGEGFRQTLELMHEKNWKIEVVSWQDTCNKHTREWVEQNGAFVALDDFYESVTYLEPSRPGHLLASSRDAVPLDLSQRPLA